VKKAIFAAHTAFVKGFPLERGKDLLGRLVKRTLGYAVYEVNGVKLELNSAGWFDRELISGRAHNPLVQEVVLQGLARGGTFLDVGANIGYFSLLAARLKGVQVFAFEPSPRELARLYRNIILNGRSNIAVLPYGLADVDGAASLNLALESDYGMNSVIDLSGFTKCAGRVECPFVRLGSILSQSVLRDVRVCKIDVEGHEMSVLRGMPPIMPLLSQAVFVIEISPAFLAQAGCTPRDIYDFFGAWGYAPRIGPTGTGHYDDVFARADQTT
jgi:FkbM family methyltransferase